MGLLEDLTKKLLGLGNAVHDRIHRNGGRAQAAQGFGSAIADTIARANTDDPAKSGKKFACAGGTPADTGMTKAAERSPLTVRQRVCPGRVASARTRDNGSGSARGAAARGGVHVCQRSARTSGSPALTMTASYGADPNPSAADVVAVEVTIDGMLVIADRLNLVDFPTTLGIRHNIPQLELRNIVWEQVTRDLTAQGVLDVFGQPHAAVAAMVDTLSRPDRTLEGRWWRRDRGGTMVRFAVCRKDDRHVIAARDGDLLVLQRVAGQVGLAGMVTVVLGAASPAEVEPLTGIAGKLSECRTAGQLTALGVAPASARLYADMINNPASWVEIVANERHPGGTYTRSDVAAGVLDSRHGRIVSIPRRVSGDLYGSFLPGTPENLQRALDGLMEFLPSGAWFDKTDDKTDADTSYPD